MLSRKICVDELYDVEVQMDDGHNIVLATITVLFVLKPESK